MCEWETLKRTLRISNNVNMFLSGKLILSVFISRLIVSLFTATLPAAPHGATDQGELCPFCSLRQRSAQWRKPLVWDFRQRLTRWSFRLLLPTGLQGEIFLHY